jgi:hypothetical protein
LRKVLAPDLREWSGKRIGTSDFDRFGSCADMASGMIANAATSKRCNCLFISLPWSAQDVR